MISSVAQDIYGGFFDVPAKVAEIGRLEEEMTRADFWDNQTEAQKTVAELTRLKSLVAPQNEMKKRLDDLKALF